LIKVSLEKLTLLNVAEKCGAEKCIANDLSAAHVFAKIPQVVRNDS